MHLTTKPGEWIVVGRLHVPFVKQYLASIERAGSCYLVEARAVRYAVLEGRTGGQSIPDREIS